MKRNWDIWLGCVALFGAGVVWGLAHAKRNFFEVDNIHDFFEIMSAVATVIAVVLAGRGLNAWRSQLSGTADHELARKILIGIHEYVEEIKAVRNPIILSYEVSVAQGEQPHHDHDVERHAGEVRAYQRRLAKLEPVKAKLYSYSIEAGAVWGEGLKEKIRSIFKFDREITIYMRYYFTCTDPKVHEEVKKSYRQIKERKRDAMMDDMSEEGDEFTRDMMNTFNSISELVSQKLIR